MKVISFILSVYVVALACFPCTDNDSCADEQKIGIELTHASDHEHSDTETDHCSPLCTCSCCATIFQIPQGEIVMPNFVKHNTFVATLYIQSALTQDMHTIWQPPRIS